MLATGLYFLCTKSYMSKYDECPDKIYYIRLKSDMYIAYIEMFIFLKNTINYYSLLFLRST